MRDKDRQENVRMCGFTNVQVNVGVGSEKPDSEQDPEHFGFAQCRLCVAIPIAIGTQSSYGAGYILLNDKPETNAARLSPTEHVFISLLSKF